ncbi:MAG TPA: HlyD family type I secretion periplasmic adaptor subunit [Hyphomicrobiaceae bacterium]|nr:HlyD family type I secretion periplasmic adaptor subunit [Hyphomicrobiaceae bacterium]
MRLDPGALEIVPAAPEHARKVTSTAADREDVASQSFGLPTAISADLLKAPPPMLNALLISLLALVAFFILWAAFATIEESARGEGRIIPASRVQVVQNLEGGIVGSLHVHEGDRVAKGDILLRIDPTKAGSDLGETRERILGLRAQIARLESEVENRPLEFSQDLVKSAPALVDQQSQYHKTRALELEAALSAFDSQARQREQELLELKARIKTQKEAVAINTAELEILRPLVAKGSVSKPALLTAEKQLNEANGALQAAKLALPRVEAQRREVLDHKQERLSSFRSDAFQKLTTARIELAALKEQNKGTADTLERTTVRAPVAGIVKTVHVNTIGQVVKPGSDLVEIVPVNDTLLVEARIKPRDIAFLHPGQPALVKITAYDFSLYGGIDGQVERVGADSITDEKGETFYLIRVRTGSNKLRHGDANLPIIPGMVTQVDVKTGQKTVLSYLTKPLTRMRQDALHER